MLTRDELLVLLIEECAEVIQAATKCLRFGYEHDQPGYGVNSFVLAGEVGDLIGVVDALPLNWGHLTDKRRAKIAKAERVLAEVRERARIGADDRGREMPPELNPVAA